jgi:hypothetical protein
MACDRSFTRWLPTTSSRPCCPWLERLCRRWCSTASTSRSCYSPRRLRRRWRTTASCSTSARNLSWGQWGQRSLTPSPRSGTMRMDELTSLSLSLSLARSGHWHRHCHHSASLLCPAWSLLLRYSTLSGVPCLQLWGLQGLLVHRRRVDHTPPRRRDAGPTDA